MNRNIINQFIWYLKETGMGFSRGIKIMAGILIIANLALLSKYILFRHSARYYKNYFKKGYFQQTASRGWKKANLVPFNTIKLMQSGRLRYEYKMDNLAGNVAGFVPLGFLFPFIALFFRKGIRTVLLVLLISLAFEYIQLRTGWGVFDVDDLILNGAGGLAGYLIFSVFYFFRKRNAAVYSAESGT
jgi:glycopeptide antibiotics resistance protein